MNNKKKQNDKKKSWDGFLKLCSAMKNCDEFKSLFDLFLTYEEREILASRFLIIKALLEGQLTQREMAVAHKVSIAQITRGSNALKAIDLQFKKYLEKYLNK